jgi:integrase
MATVNFLYRSRKLQSELQLRLLFRDEDNDYVFSAKTKLKVSKDYWDNLQHKKKPKDIDVINLQHETNKELSAIESFLLNSYHSTNTGLISKAWLSSTLDSYYNPNARDIELPTTLIEYIKYFIDQKRNEVASASITKFKVIMHKLERMEVFFDLKFAIEDVNENFKTKFIDFCKNERYSINTIQREIGLIKTFCKHARINGLAVSPQMDTLKVKKEKVKHIYLSFEELEQIESAKLELEHLENARDWLILSCYMGQRISDFMRFKKSMIRLEEGKSLIEFTQKKTNKIMTVPLHSKVLGILKKYGGDFPKPMSDQRYNDHIKTVCQKAEINDVVIGRKQENISKEKDKKIMRMVEREFEKWELVTSHIGRRSLASNFYGQIPTNYLIYITGHSSEAMFLQYIGKSNKDIAMELTKYF